VGTQGRKRLLSDEGPVVRSYAENASILAVTIERQIRRFRGVLIFSGLFNIVLAAPLMVPELYRHYLALFWKLNGILSLGGHAPVTPYSPVSALLINTAGIDLVLIGTIVLYAAQHPLSRWLIPAVNAAGRTLFAGVILYYVIVYDIPRIVLLIGGIDLMISGAFAYFLHSLRKLRSI